MIRTKELFQDLQEQIAFQAERVENGEATYLDTFLFMRENKKKIEDTLDLIKQWEKDSFEEIESETMNYKDGYKGMLFEVRNGRKTYNFKGIPEVDNAEAAFKEAKEKYKSFFIAKQKGSAYVNVDDDGEELPLPEISYGSGSIVVKPIPR